jgi:hypothetical protein
MSVSPGNPNPDSAADLMNPMFMDWLKSELGGDTLEPDIEDFEESVPVPETFWEVDQLYRLAITHIANACRRMWPVSTIQRA